MDRSIQPEYKAVEAIRFVRPEEHKVGNEFSLFHLKDVPNETCRIDLYFNAGKCLEQDGIPSFVNGLLLSGNSVVNSHEIQEAINNRGGFFSSGVSMENATITIHCLREKAVELVNIVIDAVSNVGFLEKEITEYIADQKQNYLIGLEKVSFLAQRQFQQKMFLSESNYSDVIDLDDFNNLSIERLHHFHANHYKQGLTKVAIVGNLHNSAIESILETCAPLICNETSKFPEIIRNEAGEFYIPKDGALQSAIRIGKQLFNKQHTDYHDFLILNTILGDYFGSRLMRNIREDKGYTYGIGSAVVELANSGYFVIGTEVGKAVRESALSEIRKELDTLTQTLVSQQELKLVKNYMLGQLLKSADGPYAMMDLFLSANMNDMDLDIYNQAIQNVQKISPERIQELAKKYLIWEDMSIVTAG